MKNVGFANLQQYGTLHGENACFIQGGTGEFSNVYVSASVLNDSVVAYTGLTIKNVVFDVTYTGGEIRAVNSLEEVYPSVSFLANRKNQNGELFASEKGWSSIWKIEDDDVYFGNWKIS